MKEKGKATTEVKEITFQGKSRPISNDRKAQLRSLLMNNRFQKEDIICTERREALAMAMYIALVKPFNKYVNKLPARFISEFNSERTVTIRIKGRHYDYLEALLPVKCNKIRDQNFFPILSADTPEHKEFVKEFELIKIEETKEREARSQLNTKIYAALDTVRSTKQLFELWPEAYEIFMINFPPPESLAVVIPRAELNKQLGI